MTVRDDLAKLLEPYGAIHAPEVAGIAHYGDPLGEQKHALLMHPRLDRKVIKVVGPDASSFLTSLFSQIFTGPVGTVGRALNLDAAGHIIDTIVWQAIEDGYLLHVDIESDLRTYLEAMRFWTNVNIEDTDHSIITLVERDDSGTMSADHKTVPWNGPTRVDLFLQPNELAHHLTQRLYDGYHLIGTLGWDACRVTWLEPSIGLDLDNKSIPHEVFHYIGHDEAAVVNLDKGCYRGQETVARVQNLGRSPRVLAMVHLDGSAPELPAPGSPITSGRRTVGRLGTVAQHYELGPIALALIKRNSLEVPLTAGLSALSVDTDNLVNDESTPAGKRAIERLKGNVVD
ncbi:MAG: folate-binding protein [Corynebacterium sp.]|nr:folate-binding protein [Corynebacterium sp.]